MGRPPRHCYYVVLTGNGCRGGGGGVLRGVDGLRSCEGIEYWEGRGEGLIRAITCLPGLPGTISITKKPEMVVT